MELQGLLDRARGGDADAWNMLLARRRPWVRALLRRRVRQDTDASNLTQEVQMRMDRGFARFKGESISQFDAWTRRIAANVLADYYRRTGPVVEPLPEPEALPAPVAPAAVDAEDVARLLGALEDLPAHYRTVIEGRLFDGLTCAEIGRRMGQLPGTVRTWCLRAVQQLNQRLGGRP